MNPKRPLTVDLIPRSCWGQNLRKVVSPQTWKNLKSEFAAKYFLWGEKRNCMICSRPLSLDWDLHEVWNFNEKDKTQKLIELLALCPDCHAVNHIGLAAKRGKLDQAVAHLKLVNGWSDKQAQEHIRQAIETWERRSKLTYQLDIGCAGQWLPETRIHMDWLVARKDRPSNRQDAIEWARSLLGDDDFFILDTETTGLLDKQRVEVIQLTILSSKREVVFNSLIKPKYKIPKRITEYTGISNEDVEHCHTFEALYEEISLAVNNKKLVAYNADFDRDVLNRTCDIYQLPRLQGNWMCAMRAFQAYCDFPSFGCSLPLAVHDAFNDCCATMRTLIVMADQGNAYDIEQYPAPWIDIDEWNAADDD